MINIPKGSTVLVTGVTGFIGAQVADQLIESGYKVKGVVRSLDKAEWLFSRFDSLYGAGHFKAVEVHDMIKYGAYDEAVQGVSGIIHLASVFTFSDKWDDVVPIAVKGVINDVNSAKKEAAIKSIVLTSSTASVPKITQQGPILTITEQSWNDTAVEEAKAKGANPWVVYAASKTEAERAFWKAVQGAHFHAAAVLPSAVFGEFLGPKMSVTDSWIPQLYEGEPDGILPHTWFINVRDSARLHIAALLDPTANGRRVIGANATWTINDLLASLRRVYPKRKFIDDQIAVGEELTRMPRDFAEDLLKASYGGGYTGLDETVKQNVDRYLEIKSL